MLQDWIILFIAKKLIWLMSVWASGPWLPKRNFPNPVRCQKQNYIQFTEFYNTVLPRYILPLCLGFSVWEIKMEKYGKQLTPWLKHNSESSSIDFFVPEFITFIFSPKK